MNCMIKKLPSKEMIFEFFEYDRENGIFLWRSHWDYPARMRLTGKKAGTLNKKGYYEIGFQYERFLLHRLIWFIENGTEPDNVDHINGNPKDNRIQNLRSATHRSNHQNKKWHREGRLVGASWTAKLDKWQSQAWIGGKKVYLGVFSTELEAHQAYCKAVANV